MAVQHICYWSRNPVRLRGTALCCSPHCWGTGPGGCTQQRVRSYQMRGRDFFEKDLTQKKCSDIPCNVLAGMVRDGSGGIGELRGDYSHKSRACPGLNACWERSWGMAPIHVCHSDGGTPAEPWITPSPTCQLGWLLWSQQWIFRLQQKEGRHCLRCHSQISTSNQHQPPANSYCSLSKRYLILTHILFAVWLVHCNNF